MPKRMLRDWTDSEKFDGLSAEAERLFTRLIMKADDYGRFHSDPRMVKALCFPLSETIRTNDLSRWLDELGTRQLILRYEVGGRKCLAIVNYGQRLKKSVAKFPPMPGEEAGWLPESDDFREVPGSSGNVPPEEKGREVEDEARGGKTAAGGGGSRAAGGARHGPTDADLIAWTNSLRPAWEAMGDLNHVETTNFKAHRHILAGFSADLWQLMRDYMAATLRQGDAGWQPKARVKFLETPGDLAMHATEWGTRRPKPRPKLQPESTTEPADFADGMTALDFFRKAGTDPEPPAKDVA